MPERVTTQFIDGEGASHRSPQPGVVAMHILHPEHDPIVVTLDAIHADNRECATWHGLKQKLGDKRAGKDDEEGYNGTVALLERLCESENWNLSREGAGPRTSILARAVAHVLLKAGRINQEQFEATVKEKQEACKDRTYREKAASRPDVKAEMDRIKAEAAMERAEVSEKAAASAETATDTL